MDSKPLSINELKDPFFSLKTNKSSMKKMLWGALRTLNLPILATS